jgi:hypothetical protein
MLGNINSFREISTKNFSILAASRRPVSFLLVAPFSADKFTFLLIFFFKNVYFLTLPRFGWDPRSARERKSLASCVMEFRFVFAQKKNFLLTSLAFKSIRDDV